MQKPQLKKGVMGRPGLDAARFVIDFTGIPMTPEEALQKMEARQAELFTQVSPMPGALKLVVHTERLCGAQIDALQTSGTSGHAQHTHSHSNGVATENFRTQG